MEDEEIAVRLASALLTPLATQTVASAGALGTPDGDKLLAKTAVRIYRLLLEELQAE